MTNSQSFEEKMNTLEEIVKSLDSEDITLEKSLELYQMGVTLTKECQSILKHAELKVIELNKEDGVDEQSET